MSLPVAVVANAHLGGSAGCLLARTVFVGMVATQRRLHFVRHGESAWNACRRLQGQTAHVGLTELGYRQAWSAADRLAGVRARNVLSSDLVRAVETAEAIAARLGVRVLLEPAWREQALGVLEGELREDAWSRVREEPWSADWSPEGGESTRDVYRRITAFFAGLVPSMGEELIVVTHGDTLRVALGLLEGAPPEGIPWLMVGNGAIVSRTIARASAGTWRVVGS